MYKYSILTVNYNNYEVLKDPINPRKDVEYICVTDNKDLKSDIWKIVYRPDIFYLYPKHNPFEFVSTDVCLWLDGSYMITDDATEAFIEPFIHSDKEFAISLHNTRYNVYEELLMWVYTRGLDFVNADKFFVELITHGWHQDTLFQTSVYVAKKTETINRMFEEVNRLDELCSVNGNYKDDQTIISYVIGSHLYRWDKILLMDFSTTCNNKYWHWCHHGTTDAHIEQRTHDICFDEHQPLLYQIK